MLFLAGFWKNGEAWEADADVDADIGEGEADAIIIRRRATPLVYAEASGWFKGARHTRHILSGRENLGNNEALVKRMAEEGHLIGNHTFSHVQLTKMKKEDACREVQQTNERICAVTGAPVLYIRPPYGSWNDELQAEIPMTVTAVESGFGRLEESEYRENCGACGIGSEGGQYHSPA